MNIEPLEARIAPSTLAVVDAHTATYTDVDGDLVTVKFSAGNLTVANVAEVLELSASGPVDGEQLTRIDLNNNQGFAGTKINLTAKPQDVTADDVKDGDGSVNVGWIDATGVDLGAVKVPGDLGKLVAGDATLTTSGAKSVSVASMGRFGMSTGAPDLKTEIMGKLGSLKVTGDMVEAWVEATETGAVTIGGSLIGGSSNLSGRIDGIRGIGSLKIGGDITAGTGSNSGAIEAHDIGSLKIGGSLTGTGDHSGSITAFNVGSLTIGGSITGGIGLGSGIISLVGDVGSLVIGGNVSGGAGTYSGVVEVSASAGSLKIAGSLTGGGGKDAGLITCIDVGTLAIGGNVTGGSGNSSGHIFIFDKAGNITIGGSLIGSSANQQKDLGGGVIVEGQIAVNGDLGLVKIGGSVIGDVGLGSGQIRSVGKLSSVAIGGALTGGAGGGSGQIASSGDMGAVTIGGAVTGGDGSFTGAIRSGGKMGNVTIGGALTGGAGGDSGQVLSILDMGMVKIGSDVRGGGTSSGMIFSNAKIAGVTLGGSLLGSANSSNGQIFATGDLGAVKIAGDLRGGSILVGSGSDSSGYIQGASIKSVFVGGSIVAGLDAAPSGSLTHNASIRAVNDIGSITVLGSIVGSGEPGDTNSVPVVISARGKASLPATNDVAIGKITVGGNLQLANIFAGYSTDLVGLNSDAQIGTVQVRADWISSNLLAGVTDAGDGFGNSNDVKIIGGGVVKDVADKGGKGAISKIASVIIKGGAYGTLDPDDAAVFGIEAQQLGSIKLGGAKVLLLTGAGNDLFAPLQPLGPTRATGNVFDFHAFEVPVAP